MSTTGEPPRYSPESSPLSRRKFLHGAGAAAFAAGAGSIVAACSSSSSTPVSASQSAAASAAQGETEVIYSSWGGTWADEITKAWFDPFTKATGITVTVTGPPDYGTIEAMVSANTTQWDIAEVDPDFPYIGAEKGILEPIDWSVVKKSNFLPTTNSELYTNYSVPQSLWSLVITYRTDKFGGKKPTTWADVWDTETFPGKRTFDASTLSDGVFEAALLADGVAPGDLYPLDIDRALDQFDKIKGDILWFTSGSQMLQYFQTGEAVIGTGWDGRIAVLESQKTPVSFTYNQALGQWANFVVPKGAPHPHSAMLLLNYMTEAAPQARMSLASHYGPVNPKALALIPASFQNTLSGTPAHDKLSVSINWKWWAANYDSVNEQFTSWQSS